MKRPLFIKLMVAFSFFTFLSCKKENSESKKTLNKLYGMFKEGSISICQYNGQQFIALHTAHMMLAQVYSTKTEML